MKGLFSAKQPVGQGGVRLGWLVFFSAEIGKGTVRSNWGGGVGGQLGASQESVPCQAPEP